MTNIGGVILVFNGAKENVLWQIKSYVQKKTNIYCEELYKYDKILSLVIIILKYKTKLWKIYLRITW